MPGVAANEADGVLSEWLVEESGEFTTADPIATVETEKAAVDIEADAAGRVLKTLVTPGAQVEVGAPIAVLADAGEQVDDLEALLVSLGVAPATDVVVPQRRDVPSDPESAAPVIEDAGMPAVPASAQSASAQRGSAQPASGSPASGSPTAVNGRVFASPLARKIAGDHGLPMEEIHGTGPRGRILRRDVEAALESRWARPPAHDGSPAPDSSPRSAVTAAYEEIPHSRIRLATARRLTASQQEVPHFYLRTTVRAEALLALRAELNEDAETRVTVTDLVVKAVGSAHRRIPEMNVTWTPEAVRRYRTVDV